GACDRDSGQRRDQRRQPQTKGTNPGADARLGGAERELQGRGDLVVRKLLEKSQAKGLTLRWRKLFQSASQRRVSVRVPDLLGLAGPGFRNAGEPLAVRVRLDLRAPASPAQLVGD